MLTSKQVKIIRLNLVTIKAGIDLLDPLNKAILGNSMITGG